ncbi:hypothetical protein PENTCL1PPCAC_3877, partial [Pristionchus entomophagus]
ACLSFMHNIMSASGSNQQCLVCSIPTKSLHLGMDTCRACSSFFKRISSTDRRYSCKTGDEKCSTNRVDVKIVCRSCRYDKCIAVGLEYEQSIPQALQLARPNLLQRVKKEYMALCDRRRTQELMLARAHGQQRRIPHPTEELYSVHINSCYSIFYASGLETFQFFANVFPEFKQLGGDDLETIFNDYASKLCMFECYERTRRIWGELGRFTMWTAVTCFDAETGLDGDRSSLEHLDALMSAFMSFAIEQNTIFLPLFNRIELTEHESHALMALVLTESDAEISDDALRLMDRYRNDVLDNLQGYYREQLGLTNYSRRLGNLMTLNHTIQECKSLFK